MSKCQWNEIKCKMEIRQVKSTFLEVAVLYWALHLTDLMMLSVYFHLTITTRANNIYTSLYDAQLHQIRTDGDAARSKTLPSVSVTVLYFVMWYPVNNNNYAY